VAIRAAERVVVELRARPVRRPPRPPDDREQQSPLDLEQIPGVQPAALGRLAVDAHRAPADVADVHAAVLVKPELELGARDVATADGARLPATRRAVPVQREVPL
jgi:hypothetical protein